MIPGPVTEHPCDLLLVCLMELELACVLLERFFSEDDCETTRTDMSRISSTRLRATVSVTVVACVETFETSVDVAFFVTLEEDRGVTSEVVDRLKDEVATGLDSGDEVWPTARVLKKVRERTLLKRMTETRVCRQRMTELSAMTSR